MPGPAKISFRRLFEVRILHEFYLQDRDGRSLFELAGEADKLPFLQRRVGENRYPLGRDLLIGPTAETALFLKNHGLRFAQTGTGFIVGTEWKAPTPGQARPNTDLPADVPMAFWVKLANPEFQNFTNMPLGGQAGAYHFSNKKEAGKAAPVLSRRPPEFDAARLYEMGELAFFPMDNEAKEAIRPTAPATRTTEWGRLPDGHSFVNGADRTLLVLAKSGRFPFPAPGKTAEFTLRNDKGRVLINKVWKLAQPAEAVPFDFTKDADGNPIADGFYDLETAIGGQALRRRAYLSSGAAPAGILAAIELTIGSADADLEMLDAALFFKNNYQKTGPGDARLTERRHRVFVLNFMSRKSFWRFAHSRGSPLAVVGAASSVFAASPPPADRPDLGDRVVSKTAHPMSSSVRRFGSLNLPNPSPSPLKKEGDGVFFSEILLGGPLAGSIQVL